jgi:MoaA/NifB/PqqE/SkfB family radical SAM enzyme
MLNGVKTLRRKKVTAKQLLNHLLFRFTAEKKSVLPYQPITLTFAVTDRCTFHCDMCHLHSPHMEWEPHFNVKKKDLPIAIFRDVLDTFPKARNVTLVGTGEPLLHGDFFHMVALAHARHMVTSTITNGLLLHQQTKAILASSLDTISISINGYCPEDFAYLTGMEAAHFETIVKNVKELVIARNRGRHPMAIAVSFVLDQKNYLHTTKMIRLATEMGVDSCSFHNFIPTSTKGYTAQERSLFWSEEIERFFKTISLPSDMGVTFPRLLRKDRRFAGCHFFFRTLRIDSDGQIGSCGGSLLNLDGHARYDQGEVWNCNYLVDMRERFLLRRKALPEPCYVCPHNY